ncbi:MAG TPA: cytochrome c3 family protein [Desulfurivibrionaceae bacterium]|nr:cytochrome c3 family protein [Desulfurivibrionaceae bacterium]
MERPVTLTLSLLLIGTTSAFAADMITFRNGMTFDHKGHQNERVGKCSVCHDPANAYQDGKQSVLAKPGRIEGFGKDWIHRYCTDCHDLFGEGPVKCNECHRNSPVPQRDRG